MERGGVSGPTDAYESRCNMGSLGGGGGVAAHCAVGRILWGGVFQKENALERISREYLH